MSSKDQSQKSGKRRSAKEKKPSFETKFNVRTKRLIELSRSSSCSSSQMQRQNSDSSMASIDVSLSQLSNSGVTNREKQREKRLKEREQVEPLKFEAGEKRAAAAKRVYEQLLDEKPPLMAYDVLLATLRSELSGRSLVAEEEVEATRIRMFIRDNLLPEPRDLADKYLAFSKDGLMGKKLNEYKLQALLRIFAWLPDLDRGDPIEEAKLEVQVLPILRLISSAGDSGALQSFLNDEVLETFVTRIPRHLTRLYEDLHQPVPPELSSFASREDGEGEFDVGVFTSPEAKMGTASSSAVDEKRPRLARRASFLDSRHHKLVTISSNGAKELKVKAEKKERSTAGRKEKGTRQVRRSLTFDCPTVHQTPSKKRAALDINKPSPRTPKRRKSEATLAQETPVHKQRPLSEYRREKFQRVSGQGVRQIVAETPQKGSTFVAGTRKSPRRPSSVRPVYTSAPTALTQLDEENVQGCSSLAASSTFLRPNEPASPSPMKGGSRQQTLLREFLSAKSPRKRLGKVARVLLSPCSKSPMARQDVENDALDFSSVS